MIASLFRDFQFTDDLAAIENDFCLFFTQGRYLTDRLSTLSTTAASEQHFYGHNNSPIRKHERQRRVAVCHVEQFTPIGRATVVTLILLFSIIRSGPGFWFDFRFRRRVERNKPLIDIHYGTITVQRRRSARGFRSIYCRNQAIQVRFYRILDRESERWVFLPGECHVCK